MSPQRPEASQGVCNPLGASLQAIAGKTRFGKKGGNSALAQVEVHQITEMHAPACDVASVIPVGSCITERRGKGTRIGGGFARKSLGVLIEETAAVVIERVERLAAPSHRSMNSRLRDYVSYC